MERLAVLEAEVKADADAQRARKAAAVAKLRDQRVTQTAGDAMVRKRTSDDESSARRRARASVDAEPSDPLENLGGALELASAVNQVKQELSRAPKKGEKSLIVSGVASFAFGPAGWLYAGSWREAVPAAVGWLAFAVLASKILPVFLMLSVLMVAAPLSLVGGVMYARRYNRAGKRQRLFDKKKSQAQLPGSRAGARGKQLRGDS